MSDTVEIIIRAKDEASGQIKGIGKEVSGLGKVLGTVGAAAGMAMAAVGAAVAAGFAMAVKSSIEVNAQLETTTLQFETLMGDAQLAEEHVASLFEFAEKTPFETGPIIDASLKLETFGGAALNTKDNLYLLGDAAAATNAPIDELGFWVGRLYANLQAGQPFGEAAMRLQELAVLSPQARQEMEALQRAGASASDIFGILQKDLGRFTGAMEKQANTWEGMVSTIKDQLQLLIADAMKPFFKNAKEGLSELVKLLSDPDIVAGIQAMGAELGKVADILADLTGGVIRFFADLGQRAANKQVFEDLNLSLKETRDLTNEIAEQLDVGLFITTEEDLAVQIAVREEIERRYAAELLFVDGLHARSEAEDWANEVTRRTAEETRRAATSIQNITGDVLAWRVEAALMTESTKSLATGTEIFADKMGPLKQVVEENAAAMRAAEEAAANLTAAFAGLAGDYITELPGVMEPLVGITQGVAGAQADLTVNANAAKQAIFDQLVQMEASPEVIAAYGLAIGAMTKEQAAAALAAASVAVKIDELAKAIAAGMPVEDALADLDAFIVKMEDELIPAAMTAAEEVPDNLESMVAPVGEIAGDIAAALTDGIVEGITAGTPDATKAAQTMSDDVIKTTEGAFGIESPSRVFMEIGRNLLEGLSEGVAELAPRLLGEMAAFGIAIIDGIIGGINSKGMEILSVLGDWVQAAINYAKSLLGIASPSRVFFEVGVSIGEGLIEGVRAKEGEVLDTIGSMLQGASDLGSLGSGFEGVFKRQVLDPMEGQLEAVQGQLGTTGSLIQELLTGLGLSDDLNNPWLLDQLQGIVSGGGGSFEDVTEAAVVLGLLEDRRDLLLQEQALQENLLSQQQRLMLMEQQRADLNFLQQQLDLLKLIDDNGLDISILEGIELGVDADPSGLMQAMSTAMQMMITQASSDLAGQTTPTDRVGGRSLANEFFSKTGDAGTTVVNIDARGAARGADEDIRRVVEEVMRDYGVRADIRMRTG